MRREQFVDEQFYLTGMFFLTVPDLALILIPPFTYFQRCSVELVKIENKLSYDLGKPYYSNRIELAR